jgi:hypothetical protein
MVSCYTDTLKKLFIKEKNMVVINGTVYKLSINIPEGVIADDEDEACNEVLYRLKKAGFDTKYIEIEIIDSEPNVEDLD